MSRSVDRTSAAQETGTSAATVVAVPPATDAETVAASWQTWLSGSPREVLARIVPDDPLGVRARVAARLRSDALLLDADRAHLRALARISRSAGSYRGRPGLSEWLEGAVASSIEELVREEQEWARSRSSGRDATARAPDAPECDAFASLAAPLGLDPKSMRSACAGFDALPFVDRSAFFDLVLEAADLDAAAHAAGVSASEIARRARRGLEAVLAPVSGVGGVGGSGADVEKARKR